MSRAAGSHAPFLHASRHELTAKAKKTVDLYGQIFPLLNKSAKFSDVFSATSKRFASLDSELKKISFNLEKAGIYLNQSALLTESACLSLQSTSATLYELSRPLVSKAL